MTLHRATGCLPALAHCVAALFEGYAGLDKRWGVRISSTTCVGLPNGDDPPGSILSGNPRHTTYCKSPTAAKSNSPTRCGPRRIRKWTETTTRGVQLPDQQTPPPCWPVSRSCSNREQNQRWRKQACEFHGANTINEALSDAHHCDC